jgi:hypothetical protein
MRALECPFWQGPLPKFDSSGLLRNARNPPDSDWNRWGTAKTSFLDVFLWAFMDLVIVGFEDINYIIFAESVKFHGLFVISTAPI